MLRTKRLAELKTAISLQGEVVAREIAKFRALEAEEASLQAGVTFQGKIDSLPRTDAILNVLHSAGRSLSPTQIVNLLHAAGRDDDRTLVTSTLSYLVAQKLVSKPERACYLAV
jgi:hypothetical protein